MTKQNSNVKSSSSLPKGGHKIIHSETTHLNSRSNRFITEAQSEEAIEAIKNLHKDETLKKISDLIFNPEVNSTDTLFMFRDMQYPRTK